jgi:hypothetical protein
MLGPSTDLACQHLNTTVSSCGKGTKSRIQTTFRKIPSTQRLRPEDSEPETSLDYPHLKKTKQGKSTITTTKTGIYIYIYVYIYIYI